MIPFTTKYEVFAGPLADKIESEDRPRKRTFANSESPDCEEKMVMPASGNLSRDLFVATTQTWSDS